MTAQITLTDRYIHAATRTVPEKQRADLAAELRGSIDDQVDARIAGGEPSDAAERAVLTDLGDPDRLAAGYTDRPLHLIGPQFYLMWWRLLKLLLWIVLPCAAFGVALGQTLSGAPIGSIIGSTVVVLLQVTVNLGFWTVLIFAIIERTTKPRDVVSPWTLDDLPEPAERGAGLGDMIASLVFLAIAVAVVLWDRFVGFVPTEPGLMFLSPSLWPLWMAGLFFLIALEALVAVIVYVAGRWTIALAAVNGILNVVVGAAALWLLAVGGLLNPDFFPTVIPADDAVQVGSIAAIVFGFVVAGVAVWSTLDGFAKARRS